MHKANLVRRNVIAMKVEGCLDKFSPYFALPPIRVSDRSQVVLELDQEELALVFSEWNAVFTVAFHESLAQNRAKVDMT